jgi:hypothetical protein
MNHSRCFARALFAAEQMKSVFVELVRVAVEPVEPKLFREIYKYTFQLTRVLVRGGALGQPAPEERIYGECQHEHRKQQ